MDECRTNSKRVAAVVVSGRRIMLDLVPATVCREANDGRDIALMILTAWAWRTDRAAVRGGGTRREPLDDVTDMDRGDGGWIPLAIYVTGTLRRYPSLFRPGSGFSGPRGVPIGSTTISSLPARLVLALTRTFSIHRHHHFTTSRMASIARKTLRLGMIPADGIGKEVLPVRCPGCSAGSRRTEELSAHSAR